MKITIDTKEDSKEDIKKVMQILSHFSGNENIATNFSETNESNNSGFMNMFGDESTATDNKEIPDTPPDFSSFMNLVNKKEDDNKEEKAKVQFF